MFRVWIFWTILGLVLNNPIIEHLVQEIHDNCGSDFKTDILEGSSSLDGSFDMIVGLSIIASSNYTAQCAYNIAELELECIIGAMTIKEH